MMKASMRVDNATALDLGQGASRFQAKGQTRRRLLDVPGQRDARTQPGAVKKIQAALSARLIFLCLATGEGAELGATLETPP